MNTNQHGETMASIAVPENLKMIEKWLSDLQLKVSTRGAVAGWWEAAAVASIDRGYYHLIKTRCGKLPYLLRCWLSEPRLLKPRDGHADGDPSCLFESGNSTFLHAFFQGDDDESLHDHPWDFTTTVLSGGYYEYLVAGKHQYFPKHEPGPAVDHNIQLRRVGYTGTMETPKLHAVGHVFPNTWTMVNTVARTCGWGFHPPGLPWVDYRTFLADRTKSKS